MPTKLNRLTVRGIQALAAPGRHADGGNLYLSISKTGAKSWTFFFRKDGRLREMGLGSLRDVTLVKAREIAEQHRQTLRAGDDPLAKRKTADAVPTFGKFADKHIDAVEAGWRNVKHRAQWRSTLKTHARALTEVPVDKIDTALVLSVLRPIWLTKPETASRVRGRIATILDAAKAQGLRQGDNPAAWTGHLKNLLPARSKFSRGHHAAMPIDQVPAFMAALRETPGISARALEFTILTAARSGEARGAQWREIDTERRIWTVPASRMKAGVEHRVPLADRTIGILEEMKKLEVSDLVFPGAKPQKPLSDMALTMVMRRLKADYTAHGFRSTFRDWASEETGFPHEVCEAALAHTIRNRVEAAYRRGDLFEKRRQLMAAWDRRCQSDNSTVIELPLGRISP